MWPWLKHSYRFLSLTRPTLLYPYSSLGLCVNTYSAFKAICSPIHLMCVTSRLRTYHRQPWSNHLISRQTVRSGNMRFSFSSVLHITLLTMLGESHISCSYTVTLNFSINPGTLAYVGMTYRAHADRFPLHPFAPAPLYLHSISQRLCCLAAAAGYISQHRRRRALWG